MAPLKAMWCPTGIKLVVDLGLDSPTSNLPDLSKSHSGARKDDRICQKENPNQESSTALTAPLEILPRQTQESVFHGCELSKGHEEAIESRGESSSAKALEGKVNGQLLSLASPPRVQESFRLPRHNTADMRTGGLDVHPDLGVEYYTDGETSRRHGRASSGDMLVNDLVTPQVDGLQRSLTLEQDSIHASELRYDFHHDRRSERSTESCPLWSESDLEGEGCQRLIRSEPFVGDGLRATCDESEDRSRSCENLDIFHVPESSFRESMDIDEEGDSQVSKFQMETGGSEEWDQDVATVQQYHCSNYSDENLDTDCSENPESTSQFDNRCPGIEQFNLAEISAACQLVGIGSRSGYETRLKESNCCALGLRGVTDLEWMSRTLLQLFSTIPVLDMDKLVQGSSLPRKAEEHWCSSESGTMKGSTTLDLPTGTSSPDTRQQSADPNIGTSEIEWEEMTVDDEILDRPPWMREYRSLREILR